MVLFRKNRTFDMIFAMFKTSLLHRKTHRVAEFAKNLLKTNFKTLSKVPLEEILGQK